MTVDKHKWVRGSNLYDNDFDFNTTLTKITVKTDATSSVGAAISSAIAAIPAATDTVQGKVSLAVSANYPTSNDSEAATPAFVNTAVSTAISNIPVIGDATDTFKGKVSLAVASNLPSTSDSEATTPAFVNAAISSAMSALGTLTQFNDNAGNPLFKAYT